MITENWPGLVDIYKPSWSRSCFLDARQMRWLLALGALGAWLFYESRLHGYCMAKNEADDSAIFTVLHSAACNQLRGHFSTFGLDCDRARLELDGRVRDLRVWQCHVGEHFLLSSYLRMLAVAGLLLGAVYKGWRQSRELQERRHFHREQMLLLRDLAPKLPHYAADQVNYYKKPRRRGPLIEPVDD